MGFRRVRNLDMGLKVSKIPTTFYFIVRGQPFQKITVKAYLEILDGMLRLNSAMLMIIILSRSSYYRKLKINKLK